MKAAVWRGAHTIQVGDWDTPRPKENEVLLRVMAAGICGTDLTIYLGKFDPQRSVPPMIPGHELSGVIAELGPGVRGWRVGERVTVDPLMACGACYACTHGLPHVCTSLKILGVDRDGGFAEYVAAQADRLYRLPDRVSDVDGALVEPLAVAVHDVRRAELGLGDTALVIGAGPIGLLIAMAADRAGARRVAIAEVNEHRVSAARELGLRVFLPAEDGFQQRLREEFDRVGPDVVFDASGSAAGYQAAVDAVRVRGRVVQVGIPKGKVELDLRRLNFAEITVVGTRVYAPQDIVTSIGLLAQGQIEARRLVSQSSLSECGSLLEELTAGNSRRLKPVMILKE